MLKALAGTTLFVGLADLNVELIQQDRPILIKLKELGIQGGDITEIVIFHGKTDQDLFTAMKPLIDPLKTIFKSDQADKN